MANQGFLRQGNKFSSAGCFGGQSLCIIVLILAVTISGCSTDTTFRVLDAETKKPVEGAVALATWTKYKGLPGLSYGYTAKAIEAVSDKDGYFIIPGVTGTIAFNTPYLQVYKPGYVGWNSRRIYLGYFKDNRKNKRTKKRDAFLMKNQDIYLEPWKNNGVYNHYTHNSFVAPSTGFEEGGVTNSKYRKAIRYEVMKKRIERSLHKKRR
ncbi:MAG TPA: carboxypeptidase regulatory-like domain-containing protein [Desulfobacterales bacterium]|nr:carboxypeptidase regulatory-like domain-containing protein [Desulfobacterales bacterium]HIP39246.1 carboxypeptidase regulatory-like domain-containing protein [Desulfocapsa sulfexigens]